MGLRTDLDRYHKVGEQNREDLKEFIKYGDLGNSTEKDISIPVKIVDLPEFVYSDIDSGGIGQADGDADPQQGDTVQRGIDQDEGDDDADGKGEPGDSEGEVDYKHIDPEKFAEELDEELGLDLEPKGKKVVEETEGAMTDRSRNGPSSMLDVDRLYKKGLQRKIAIDFDEEYLQELLKVSGVGPSKAFDYAREQNIPVSYGWFEDTYKSISNTTKYDSISEFESQNTQKPTHQRFRDDGIEEIPFRQEDERYRYPEIVKEREKQVVIFNIRDVSGSMRQEKRDLVERTLQSIDWYIQGKYDNAVVIYIAHNRDAWEVERTDFFGMTSGGGTRISSAYEYVYEMLDEYPWSEWNRYVFAAGDGENTRGDSEENVAELVEKINANHHAYIETVPNGKQRTTVHGDVMNDIFSEDELTVARVTNQDDVIDAIKKILQHA